MCIHSAEELSIEWIIVLRVETFKSLINVVFVMCCNIDIALQYSIGIFSLEISLFLWAKLINVSVCRIVLLEVLVRPVHA